jgi:GNAT superfamily N-acetyltransferase
MQVRERIKRFLRFFYQSREFRGAVVDLPQYKSPGDVRKREVQLRAVEIGDLPMIRILFGERVAEKIRTKKRFATPYLIFYGEAPAGYIWTGSSYIPREGRPPFLFDIRPKSGVVYLFDGYVLENRRRMGILTASMDRLLTGFRQKGYKAAFFIFEGSNRGTAKMGRKLGFRVVGSVRHRRMMGVPRRRLSSLERICELRSREK